MQRRKNIDVMKTQWPKTACGSFFFTPVVTSFDCTCQRTKFHPLAEFEINLPIQNEAKLYNQEGDLECV